jgi:hypothetical protein
MFSVISNLNLKCLLTSNIKVKYSTTVISLVALSICVSGFAQEKTHPNVIIIMSDDKGYWDCY